MARSGPIPDSYWLIDGMLLAGEYPGTFDPVRAKAKLEKFVDAGIRTFIDLTEVDEGLAHYDNLLRELERERSLEIRHRRFAIRDLGTPRERKLTERILETIREEIAAGRPVYVHCWGGVGRTGTVIGCWLVEQGIAGPKAIERIAKLRKDTPDGFKRSPETDEQRRYICEWRGKKPPRKSLRIPLTVVRASTSGPQNRVRYTHRGYALIPEELILRRWKDRSKEESAKANGIRFDGCRIPPGTWRLLRTWFDAGLSLEDVGDAAVLARHAERTRKNADNLRAPQAEKFAAMLTFLARRGVLPSVMNRPRDAKKPGIPDLFLYRVDREGGVHGGRFVEVKKWNRRERSRERVSPAQKSEIAFLTALGLAAQVVYLLE